MLSIKNYALWSRQVSVPRSVTTQIVEPLGLPEDKIAIYSKLKMGWVAKFP
jgi:hypothetical protein